jgi:acetyltransferase-like isoleucine patch superfamily enzyme
MIKTLLYYKQVFKTIGYKSIVMSPLKIEGSKNIKIENNVFIGYKTWLSATPYTNEPNCILEIQEGCAIGNFNHIISTGQVLIMKNVLTADRVYISDNLHGYKDISLPIIKQPVVQNNTVIIGEGSWIGENACILGAHIGKNCVIGANSVVTKDIPDYCIAVGAPAKIIKRYNEALKTWLPTNSKGEFNI